MKKKKEKQREKGHLGSYHGRKVTPAPLKTKDARHGTEKQRHTRKNRRTGHPCTQV